MSPPLLPSSLENVVCVLPSYHGGATASELPLLRHREKAAEKTFGINIRPGGEASFVRTCFNGVNALSGVGILSIPYALSEGGWLSLAMLIVFAAACCYTGLLLQRCMDGGHHLQSYPDIGELAFGSSGRVTVSVFIYLELYLVCTGFLILEGDNLDKLFPNASLSLGKTKIEGKQLFTLLAGIAILPVSWLRSLGALAFVSFGGVLASVILIGCVFYAGAMDGVGFSERGRLFNPGGLPTSLGLYAFCYCGHAVFPTLLNSMKDRTKFPTVLSVCFLVCTLCYSSMAVIGYLMYGDDVESQVTLNLPIESWTSKIAIYTTLINPFTKYALMLSPMASAIEQRLPGGSQGLSRLLTRALLVGSTVAIAISVPLFGYLMALIGSFLSVVAALLLPCVCYLKIYGLSGQSKTESVAILGILVMGVLVGVTGTYSSLRQIAQQI
ncbi:amino acid transporter AVT1I-like [Wolffia australiana]